MWLNYGIGFGGLVVVGVVMMVIHWRAGKREEAFRGQEELGAHPPGH